MLENAAGVVNGPSGDISPGAATRRATGLPLNVKMAYDELAPGKETTAAAGVVWKR